MTQTARLPEDEADATDLVAVESVNALAVFTDPAKFSEFYTRLKTETEKHVPNVSTERGRAAVRSLAFSVTKAKTALDKQGLRLTEDWRNQIALVNASRKQMVTELDGLAAEVRQPLTEWEEVEKARVARCRETIDEIKTAAVITLDDTSDNVRMRAKFVWDIEIGEEFGELTAEAEDAKQTALATLQRALERLKKEEADRAELEELRAAAAERERIEAEKAEAERLINQRRNYARAIIEHIRQCGLGMIDGKTYPYIILIRELEEKIVVSEDDFGDMVGDVEKARIETLAHVKSAAAKQAERSRQEAVEQAAQAARDEATRKASAEQDERDRKHEAQLADERRQREDVERAAEQQRKQREREDQERDAEATRIAAEKAAQEAEDRRREADRAHRSKVQREAKESIMGCGVDEATAKMIVVAIVAGNITHVTLRF